MTAGPAPSYELFDPPSDGVSSLEFCPIRGSGHLLLATSWDKSVRLYDVTSNSPRSRFQHRAPVLDACFGDAVTCYSGGLDRKVYSFDFNVSSTPSVIGSHDDAVRSVRYSAAAGLVATGSWDKSFRTHDPRQNGNVQCATKSTLPDRVFSMDICSSSSVAGGNPLCVVAMASRHLHIYDLRNPNAPLFERESSLRYQIRTVRFVPDGSGFVTGSIEGRVAVEYVDPAPEAQGKKYAFKCHRITEEGLETVFPVNALAFHPIHNTFASGGCDGVVCIWDAKAKKRLKRYAPYPTSISALSFSADGKTLAIASSYTFEEGEKDHAPDSIYIRSVEQDVVPTGGATGGN